MDPDPYTELEHIENELETTTTDMYCHMSNTNSLTAERAKLQASIKKRKKEDKPEKTGLRIFTTDTFAVFREPVEIAREMYTAVTAVPPKWTASGTEAKLKELVNAYEEKVKKTANKKERMVMLEEYFKSKAWLEKFSAAINQPDGVARSRLYDILNDGLVRGKWRENLEEAMERVKKEYESAWKEKLLPKGVTTKSDTTKAATQKGANTNGQSTGGKKTYRFSKLTEYRASGLFMRDPAFPRPKNLPAHLKLWCGKCCWSDHQTKDCPTEQGVANNVQPHHGHGQQAQQGQYQQQYY